MLRIELLPAEQGDAIWIEYGDSAHPRRALYDGGTRTAWNVLRERIVALPPSERQFELLVASHIDKDHIEGLLSLLEDAELGCRFGDIWFNGYRHLPNTPLESMGPVEGERLTTLLKDRPWNDAFGGRAVAISAEGPLPVCELPGGLRVTLLSPGEPQLTALKPVWCDAIRANGLDPQVEPPPLEFPPGIEPLGPQPTPDVARLAATRFKPDTAKPNGTSIAVLLEYERHGVILSADAFARVLLASAERLLAQRGGGDRLRVSAFKLPHHGSRGNVHLPLLRKLDTTEYLFSTNGSSTRHPDLEAVARVLVSSSQPRLWFNYRTVHNEIWGQPEVIKTYRYTARFPADANAGITVDIPALEDPD